MTSVNPIPPSLPPISPPSPPVFYDTLHFGIDVGLVFSVSPRVGLLFGYSRLEGGGVPAPAWAYVNSWGVRSFVGLPIHQSHTPPHTCRMLYDASTRVFAKVSLEASHKVSLEASPKEHILLPDHTLLYIYIF